MHADNGKAPEDRNGREPSYQELLEENARLRKELADVQWERDNYRNGLAKFVPEDILDLSAEDILKCVDTRPSLEEIIQELKKDPEYGKQRR